MLTMPGSTQLTSTGVLRSSSSSAWEKPDHAPFGRAVGDVSGDPHLAGLRGDVDDRAAAAGEHARAARCGCPRITPFRLMPSWRSSVAFRLVDEGADRHDPGVVDEHVDRAELLFDLGDRKRPRSRGALTSSWYARAPRRSAVSVASVEVDVADRHSCAPGCARPRRSRLRCPGAAADGDNTFLDSQAPRHRYAATSLSGRRAGPRTVGLRVHRTGPASSIRATRVGEDVEHRTAPRCAPSGRRGRSECPIRSRGGRSGCGRRRSGRGPGTRAGRGWPRRTAAARARRRGSSSRRPRSRRSAVRNIPWIGEPQRSASSIAAADQLRVGAQALVGGGVLARARAAASRSGSSSSRFPRRAASARTRRAPRRRARRPRLRGEQGADHVVARLAPQALEARRSM